MKSARWFCWLMLPGLLPGAYEYYYTDPLQTIGSAWIQNGSLTASTAGLTSTDPAGGSLIAVSGPPDQTAQYEVSTTLTLLATGGTFVHYLRASSTARSGPSPDGSFYAVELTPTVSINGCSASLTLGKRVANVFTSLAATTAPCRNGMVVRSAQLVDRIHVYVDGVLYIVSFDSDLADGKPGIGVYAANAGNTITPVRLGALDRVAPGGINAQSVGVSTRATSVDLQWAGVADDANGIGVWLYHVWRDGVWIDNRQTPRITDDAVQPNGAYTYQIQACDYHYNCSAPATVVVNTPPAGAIEPRRAGVRASGSYWGGAGEQIDTRSGNLNFSLPLLKAMGRGGWNVDFRLSYNSQAWRQDSGGVWKLGGDVGYGFGWRLMADSLAPVWADLWTLHHYVYTDGTGAEYRLDVNNNGVWTSRAFVFAIPRVFLGIRGCGSGEQLLYLRPDLFLLLPHPVVAHGLVFARVGLDFSPVQGHPPQFHRACFQHDLQHLLEQTLQRRQMDLPEIGDRAEIRRVAGRQHPERHVFHKPLLNLPCAVHAHAVGI